jgi:hypothetical protein
MLPDCRPIANLAAGMGLNACAMPGFMDWAGAVSIKDDLINAAFRSR